MNGPEELPVAFIRTGSEHPPPERTILRAGPLQAVFEEGGIRAVTWGATEIVRCIYVGVRDASWGTVPAVVSGVQIREDTKAFHINYSARHQSDSVDFEWKATIIGEDDGTVTFSMDGVAGHDFFAARVGLCVLHPDVECAGKMCTLERPDRSQEQRRFPVLIAPHQPMTDIRSITYDLSEHGRVEILLDGDAFEMEDQRNWLDASFKTYNRPLRMPKPYVMRKRDRVRQSATIRVHGRNAPTVTQPEDEAGAIGDLGECIGRLPEIGIAWAADHPCLTEREVDRLGRSCIEFIHIELHPGDCDLPQDVSAAIEIATGIGADVEIALFVRRDREEEDLSCTAGILASASRSLGLRELGERIKRVFIFDSRRRVTDPRVLALARSRLGPILSGAAFGAGTDDSFVDLNRRREAIEGADFVTFAVHPQAHAFDDRSIMETPPTLGTIVETCREFCGHLPIACGPITLKSRTGKHQSSRNGLPWDVDQRQVSLLCAAWTAATAKYAAVSGIRSGSWFETVGMKGIMDSSSDFVPSGGYGLQPGFVYPVFHVLSDLAEFAGAEVLRVRTPEPTHCSTLAMRKGPATRIISANMTGETRRVSVAKTAEGMFLSILDERSARPAMDEPAQFRRQRSRLRFDEDGICRIDLGPYAYMRLDSVHSPP